MNAPWIFHCEDENPRSAKNAEGWATLMQALTKPRGLVFSECDRESIGHARPNRDIEGTMLRRDSQCLLHGGIR